MSEIFVSYLKSDNILFKCSHQKRLEHTSKSVAILRKRASEAAELDMTLLSLNEYSQVKVRHSTM